MIAAKLDARTGKVTSYIATFLAGWLVCSAWYGTLHLNEKAHTLQVVQTQVVPKLKAEAGCEHWRADQVSKLALQPNMVDPEDLPASCPHPKIASVPAPN